MADPKLPRGVLKIGAEALEDAGGLPDDWEAARIVLGAAFPAIERAVLRQAAKRILMLESLSRGHLCPACHAKPVSAPHLREGRTGYRCACGREWMPPANGGWAHLETRSLLGKLARGEPLPELPPKENHRG